MLVRKEYEKGKWRLAVIWSNAEIGKLLKNFAGCLVFRGRSRIVRRHYEKLLLALKTKLKKNPHSCLRQAFDNLYPLFAGSQRKFGKKFIMLPAFATGNRRYVMVMNWLVRKHKGRGNTRGYNIDEICRLIIEASNNRGKAITMKKYFYKNVLATRHMLKTYNQEEEEDSFELTKRILGMEEDDDDIQARIREVKNELPTYRSVVGDAAADDFIRSYAEKKRRNNIEERLGINMVIVRNRITAFVKEFINSLRNERFKKRVT